MFVAAVLCGPCFSETVVHELRKTGLDLHFQESILEYVNNKKGCSLSIIIETFFALKELLNVQTFSPSLHVILVKVLSEGSPSVTVINH